MKPSLLFPGALVCALLTGTATAGDPSGMQQRVTGSGFTAWLLADGTVCVAAQPVAAPCTPVARLQEIVQLAAQGTSLVARQADGRVWAWQPAGFSLPRPVKGLPGKATNVALSNDGHLHVVVSRLDMGAATGASEATATTLRLVPMRSVGLTELVPSSIQRPHMRRPKPAEEPYDAAYDGVH